MRPLGTAPHSYLPLVLGQRRLGKSPPPPGFLKKSILSIFQANFLCFGLIVHFPIFPIPISRQSPTLQSFGALHVRSTPQK